MIRPIFAAAFGAFGARRAGFRHDHRADRQPVRHQGLAGHRTHGAAGRAQLLVPRRLDPGRSRQGRHRPFHRRHARRGRRRPRRQDFPRAARAPRHRAVVSAPRAIISAARCARSTRTATRPSTCSGSRSRSRVLPPTRSSACAARNWPTGSASWSIPTAWPANAWWSAAFPGHPYGRESNGTPDTMQRITAEDMRAYVRRAFARNELTITIVGDVDAEAAGKLIDRAFGALPAHNDLKPVAQATPRGLGRRIVINLDVPQAVVTFGGVGIARHDPDFIRGLRGQPHSGRRQLHLAALPGSAREARSGLRRVRTSGLAAGHRGGDRRHRHRAPTAPATRSRSSSSRSSAWPSRARRRPNWRRPSPISKGAYALTLDTSTKIAAQLNEVQVDNLGIDYMQRRGALIDAVTIEDAKRVAKRLYGGGMLATVVGKPKGVTSIGAPE